MARVSLAGAIAFLALLALLHLVKPELDPAWRMVSEYAIGPYGWLMVLAFFALSLSCFAAFAAVRSQVGTVGGKLGLGLLVTAGAALAAAGVFTSDPITASEEQLTTHGYWHGLSAAIGIPGLPLAAVLVSHSLARAPRWSSARRTLLATAYLSWVALGLLLATIAVTLPRNGGKFGPSVPVGWPNRFLVVTYCVWLIAVARGAGRPNDRVTGPP